MFEYFHTFADVGELFFKVIEEIHNILRFFKRRT
jgi:hypothetical protein